MGLKFSDDLVGWHRWQASRNPLRRLRSQLNPSVPQPLFLSASSNAPSLLVVVDAATPSQVSAYLAPALAVRGAEVAVLAGADISQLVPPSWSHRAVVAEELPTELDQVRVVFASGHFLPASAAAYEWSQALSAEFVVAQHGLLTPYQPPLPRDAHLLAFSKDDAAFWISGREDVTFDVVGSQMLWEAGRAESAASPARHDRPIFLGQLHGAELSRRLAARTAVRFCLDNEAAYRPHPAEVDKLSRLQHSLWARRGVSFERSGKTLALLSNPVVSVFSTGVLEAAASGREAWVTCIDAPEWVLEFWSRYGLSEWGGPPTPKPSIPVVEPSEAVAQSLTRILQGAT